MIFIMKDWYVHILCLDHFYPITVSSALLLELIILLPQSPKEWGYWHAPYTYLICTFLNKQAILSVYRH